MNIKVYISPSDQTKNIYAGTSTNEAVQCRKIGRSLEKALDRCGFYALCNTTSGMYERIAESNRGDFDIHLCIHTNAANKKVTGTRIFVYSMNGEAYKIAKAIFNELAPLTPGTSENISVNKSWAEIKNTNALCIYIEVDFHDVASVAKWIISHTEAIAESIAEGLCNHYGIKYKAPNAVAKEFKVKVTADELNIRKGPGTKYDVVGSIKDKGTYTIVEVKGNWGKLKSGKGYIHLGYTKRV